MIKEVKTENVVNVPKILCQFVSPMATGDKLQGQGIQHIPPLRSLDFCSNCQQGCGIANIGGAGFCGVNDHGLQPGLRPKKSFHVCQQAAFRGQELSIALRLDEF